MKTKSEFYYNGRLVPQGTDLEQLTMEMAERFLKYRVLKVGPVSEKKAEQVIGVGDLLSMSVSNANDFIS